MSISIKIKVPSLKGKDIAPYRSIVVKGDIKSDKPLKEGTIFKCVLIDSNNKIQRYTQSSIKNNHNLLINNDLTLYPNDIDTDKEEYRSSGFVEMLHDEKDKDNSLRKASTKAFFNDYSFRTIIYNCSNSIFSDGVNWLDDNGQEFKPLPLGKYLIKVYLIFNNEIIAEDNKEIEFKYFDKTMICRFNPKEHKDNMLKWAKENSFMIVSDDLPGYLPPYHDDLWLYHMGLLKMYRANDITLYAQGKVHMFVYEIADDSTSYRSELAYLQVNNCVDDHKRFEAFCYDIGETSVKGKKANIVSMNNEYLHLYRMDIVNKDTKENLYDLNESNLIETCFDNYVCNIGDKVAFTGVCKPYQLSPNDFVLRDDNTYEILNYMNRVVYTFKYQNKLFKEERKLNMDRYQSRPLEKSVYEFYNLFEIDERFNSGKWEVNIDVYDAKGNLTPCKKTFSLTIR